MSQLSKTEIQRLILEAVQELKSELEPRKDKNGDPRDIRVHPIRAGKDGKLLLLDKETEANEADILELGATLDESEEPVCEGCLVSYMNEHFGMLEEATYKGRKVPIGRPMPGDVQKSKVYVKDPQTGNVKKVNFGDPNMKIKKNNPARRKSFRARHKCSQKKDRTTAGYWSCRAW